MKSMRCVTHLLFAWFLLVSCAWAATVQVQVQDAKGRPLQDAVVFLESAEASSARLAAKPPSGIEIAQVGRQFDPRVLVVQLGTAVQFPNRDNVRHHVYSFSPAKNFELKLYSGTPANPVVFGKAGVVVLGCNIHDHMVAWVIVVDTLHFGRSPAGGSVSLVNVPPGTYRLRLWHPDMPVGAPALAQPLTVEASGSVVTARIPGV
jgi:plastocyanin